MPPKKTACDSCHSKKISCDRAQPRCEWCETQNLQCRYERLKKKPSMTKGTKSGEPNIQHLLDQRIRRLKSILGVRPGKDPSVAKVPAAKPHSLGKSSPTTLYMTLHGNLNFVGVNLGKVLSRNASPMFSDAAIDWIRQRTGISDAFGSIPRATIKEDHSCWPSHMNKSHLDSEFPTRETVETYLRNFFDSPMHHAWPVVDCSMFQETISLAYRENTKSRNPPPPILTARLCVLAFVILTSRLVPGPLGSDITRSERDSYVRQVQRSLSSVVSTPTIEGLQTALILSLYFDILGNIHQATTYHSIAKRCLFALRGHLGLRNDGEDIRYGEQLRNLFWLCYYCDKHNSLRTGLPPCINDDECDLGLEWHRDLFSVDSIEDTVLNETFERPSATFPSDLRLTIIKSRVLRALYSSEAAKKPDADILRDVRELDDELERWRLSIPQHMRPSLSSTQPSKFHDCFNTGVGGILLFIHIEYLYLVCFIHQACWRFEPQSLLGSQSQAMQSSLELSVQASRIILLYMRSWGKILHHAAFWSTRFYPMWSTITIFFNILHQPEADSVPSDIKILEFLPQLLHSFSQRVNLYPREVAYVTELKCFTSEMAELAKAAQQRQMNASQEGEV